MSYFTVPRSLENQVRDKRDGLLQEVVWILDRDRDEEAAGLPKTYSKVRMRIINIYIEKLRDVPQQEGFPKDILWPDKPNFL